MRARWVFFLSAACGSVALAVAGYQEEPPKKFAFLVGVNQYKTRSFPDLQFAENDARELHKELEKLGFQVKTLTGKQATREAIERELLNHLEGVGKRDIVLVSLCGHGVQLAVDGKDDAFFCPYDAVGNDPKTLFSLSRLTDDILHHRGGKNLVLIDACRDEPADPNRGMRGVQGKVVALPEDSAMLFAVRAGARSFENQALKHGLFTHAVLDGLRGGAMRGGVLTWTALVDHVANAMDDEKYRKLLPAGKNQDPIAAGQMGRVVLGRIADRRVVNGIDVMAGTKGDLVFAGKTSPHPLVVPFGDTAAAKAAQEAWAKHLGIAVKTDSSASGIKAVLIPPGTFMMGSPTTEQGRESFERQHLVILTQPFYLTSTEVTKQQYQTIMKSDSSKLQEGNLPKAGASWFDAVRACNRLSELDGLSPYYKIGPEDVEGAVETIGGKGWRLPTEAEWEFACRAGTTTPFHCGGVLNRNNANFGEPQGAFQNPQDKAVAVGQYEANAFELFDMHGNVDEWCWDPFAAYSGQEQLNPLGPANGQGRVFRGGNYANPAGHCRSASRVWIHGHNHLPQVGIRLARTP